MKLTNFSAPGIISIPLQNATLCFTSIKSQKAFLPFFSINWSGSYPDKSLKRLLKLATTPSISK